jgi:hypothetical protein
VVRGPCGPYGHVGLVRFENKIENIGVRLRSDSAQEATEILSSDGRIAGFTQKFSEQLSIWRFSWPAAIDAESVARCTTTQVWTMSFVICPSSGVAAGVLGSTMK